MYKVSDFTQSYYRIGEVAKLLGVTVQTLHNYDRKGILNFDKSVGGHRYIKREVLLNYLKCKYLLIDDVKGMYDVLYIDESSEMGIDMQVAVLVKGFQDRLKNIKIISGKAGLDDLILAMLNNEVSNIYVININIFSENLYHYIELIASNAKVNIYSLNL